MVHEVESDDDELCDEMEGEEWQHEQSKKGQGAQRLASDRVLSMLQIKGTIILLIIANSANSHCNAFQVIQGFFLELVNAPECIINVLAHGGWSVSVATVVNMVKALTREH